MHTHTLLSCMLAVGLASAAAFALPPQEPLTPDFNTADAPAAQHEQPFSPHIAQAEELGIEPVRIAVPSLGLDVPIIPVGLNHKGEMAVPDGRTLAVGWYAAGTRPGNTGSAVLAAHVYAAFQRLKNIQPGAEIHIYGKDGSRLTFVAEEKTTYTLRAVPAQRLFHRSDGEWLNLITCAGTYSRQLGTYDHRLLVHARLVR